MGVVVYGLGIVQMMAGGLVWIAAPSVMHEVLAGLLFGFGVLAMGLGALLYQLQKR